MLLPLDLDIGDDAFRTQVRDWLGDHLTGEYADVAGRGGPGDEDAGFDVRVAWEHLLGRAGLIGLGWPREHGGRGATVAQQVIWAEEYVRAGAPARVNHMGEHLLGPTLIEFGTPEQRTRFLPGILDGTVRWCQGYSEPDAGSDLANVTTRAELRTDDGGVERWFIDGQKVWTSLAHVSHWCFLLARTDPTSRRHHGLSFLLVPVERDGVEIRRIDQLTGGGEFCEMFFDSATTDAELVVGAPGDGWRVAMGLLAMERGISTLAQQVGFERELDDVVATAAHAGRSVEPPMRRRLVDAHIGLRLMRWNAVRNMSTAGLPGPEASLSKLFWGTWHRALGQLAIDVSGPVAHAWADGDPAGDPHAEPHHEHVSRHRQLFLFSRADTIYGGSNQVQRNILGERVLGLPKEQR
ncbi:MAG: acyl-CoA dehydrogenase family protein [Ilumatobacteraceae bacterium]